VDVWTHDRWRFPLPERHRFPIEKYTLLRERLVADGIVRPEEVREADPVPWSWLEAVHDRRLVQRIRTGAMTVREQRALGLPWSAELVERARRSVGGTVAAARQAADRGVGMHLGGGTHHAGRAFARGYCLFNDVAVALARLRLDGLAERALVQFREQSTSVCEECGRRGEERTVEGHELNLCDECFARLSQ
jgi:acetoin utilization deacetylase AcuC-like enzyme